MMTGLAICSDMRWPTARATTSTAPPAANGTMIRIGFAGYVWASAALGINTALNSTLSHLLICNRLLVTRLILISPCVKPLGGGFSMTETAFELGLNEGTCPLNL